MSTETIPPGPTQSETLFGSLSVVVKFEDNRPCETVPVRQLKIKEYPALLNVQDDELKMIELYTGKVPGWAEALTPESIEDVVKVGETLNADFFSRWVQRRLARQERLVPGVTQRMTEAALSASQGSSAKSQ
ncbi:MAG: hypothetical protein JWR19_2154 [Pedosphaera sp.]|nr:hypothetical protein [Pedosphaera sp.]